MRVYLCVRPVRVYLKFVLRNTCVPTLLVASPARVCGCVVNVCKNWFVYSMYFVVCLRQAGSGLCSACVCIKCTLYLRVPCVSVQCIM